MGSYINATTDLLDRYVVMLRICVGSMLFDSAAEVTLGLCRIPYKPYIGFLASESIVLRVVNASMILLGLQGLKPLVAMQDRNGGSRQSRSGNFRQRKP